MEAKRTLSEILIEADNTESVHVIDKLWEEIQLNRRDFTISELKFAKEHLAHLTKSMAKKDVEYFSIGFPYARPFEQEFIMSNEEFKNQIQLSQKEIILTLEKYRKKEYKWRYVWNLFKSLMKEINGLTFKKIFKS